MVVNTYVKSMKNLNLPQVPLPRASYFKKGEFSHSSSEKTYSEDAWLARKREENDRK